MNSKSNKTYIPPTPTGNKYPPKYNLDISSFVPLPNSSPIVPTEYIKSNGTSISFSAPNLQNNYLSAFMDTTTDKNVSNQINMTIPGPPTDGFEILSPFTSVKQQNSSNLDESLSFNDRIIGEFHKLENSHTNTKQQFISVFGEEYYDFIYTFSNDITINASISEDFSDDDSNSDLDEEQLDL